MPDGGDFGCLEEKSRVEPTATFMNPHPRFRTCHRLLENNQLINTLGKLSSKLKLPSYAWVFDPPIWMKIGLRWSAYDGTIEDSEGRAYSG